MTPILRLLLVFAGGGAGSVLRYGLTLLVHTRASTQFPWGTLAVNLVGCTAIGVLGALFDYRQVPPELRLLFIVGLLGGFTTFSSFGYESLRLFEAGRWMHAGVYILSSNLLGIALAAAGYALVKHFAGNGLNPS